MGKRNIDRLRDENDENVTAFLLQLFDRLGVALPYTLCKRCKVGRSSCNYKKCPYKEESFVEEWLYSEDIGVR